MIDIFIARQPIFDRAARVAGYELLYRATGEATRAEGPSIASMSGSVLVHAFLGIGIDRVTQGTAAFLNFPTEMILDEQYQLLDPRGVIIELLETVDCSPVIEDALDRMTSRGYRVALDDFEIVPERMPLLRYAEIVKIDVLGMSPQQLRWTADTLRPYGVRLLAERVETAGQYAECKALGFELFQGYHFARPETLARREVPMEHLRTIELMNLLQDQETPEHRLDEELRATPAIAYRLLRIVNSAATGGRGIQSILHAVRLVGRQALHRWLALVMVSSLVGDDAADLEQLQSSLRCARMCEQLAMAVGRPGDAGPLFMVGILARLDLLLGRPISEIVARLSLDEEVRSALERRGGRYLPFLELVEAYEAGQWSEVEKLSANLGMSAAQLPSLWLDGLSWGRERMHLARA